MTLMYCNTIGQSLQSPAIYTQGSRGRDGDQDPGGGYRTLSLHAEKQGKWKACQDQGLYRVTTVTEWSRLDVTSADHGKNGFSCFDLPTQAVPVMSAV